MLLLNPVLAVLFSGLLVSASPGPIGSVEQVDETESTDNGLANSANQLAPSVQDAKWTVETLEPLSMQVIMDSMNTSPNLDEDSSELESQGPTHIPDMDPPHRNVPPDSPQPPYEFPEPPHDLPKPPQPPRPGPPGSPPPKAPPKPPHKPFPPGRLPRATVNTTIYSFLANDPGLSRIFNLVNYTEEITNLLNDTSANVTFFATPNWAFPKPRRPPPRHEARDVMRILNGSYGDAADVLATAENLLTSIHKPNEDVLKKILTYILHYQILPGNLSTSELAKNLTHPTSLVLEDGSLDGEPFRVRVENRWGFSLHVNLFSRVSRGDVFATNGVVHFVDKAILPPPSVFQTTFLLPEHFSTLTSALQHSGLYDALEWSNIGRAPVKGAPAVTIFAPTNKAFAVLPRNLRMFLFSPFGEKALRKLLQFHIVPDIVLHSNYLHNASESDVTSTAQYDAEVGQMYEHLDYSSYYHMDPLEDTIFSTRAFDHIGAKPLKGHRVTHNKGKVDISSLKAHDLFPRHKGHNMESSCVDHSRGNTEKDDFHAGVFRKGALRNIGLHPRPPFLGGAPFGGPPCACRPASEVSMSHEARPPHVSQDPPKEPIPAPPHPPEHPKAPLPHPKPSISYGMNVTVPTLLGTNHSLDVHVVQFQHPKPGIPLPLPPNYHTVVFAHGVKVALPDVPMRNGAIHVISKLLNPLKHGRAPGPDYAPYLETMNPFNHREDDEDDGDEWADWEQWLPRWAEE